MTFSRVHGLILLVGLASTASAFVVSPTPSMSTRVTSTSLFDTPLNESSDANTNSTNKSVSSNGADGNIPLTIKERVANLMKIIKENDREEINYIETVKKLPKPVFQSADEVTAYIRKCALEKRDALEKSRGDYICKCVLEKKRAALYDDFSNYQKYQVSKEKCNTFRLPEAATELFLHAEKWYFFRGDEQLGDGPCFTPTPYDKYNGGIDLRDELAAAWIEIGGANDGWVFEMCIDPESTEFGNIQSWHDGGGPDSAYNILSEKGHKNGERFLIYLEEYAKRFIVNGVEFDDWDVELLTDFVPLWERRR